uniref:Uncharacterized protein n=1 Tax=Dulem virus 221 TaxID=3145698 RepID=A0AAU8B327_9VIRU
MTKKTDSFNLPDESCILYKGTVFDDVELVCCEDGSSYLRSDIEVLKSLNSTSSPALAESLSARMQLRKSFSVNGGTDKEIMSSIKPRYTQDATEMAAFARYTETELSNVMEKHDLDESMREAAAAAAAGIGDEPSNT